MNFGTYSCVIHYLIRWYLLSLFKRKLIFSATLTQYEPYEMEKKPHHTSEPAHAAIISIAFQVITIFSNPDAVRALNLTLLFPLLNPASGVFQVM